MAKFWYLNRSAEPERGVGTAAGLSAAFVVLAITARVLCIGDYEVPAFWPANAAIVVALLTLPPRLGWLTCATCFAANLFINDLSAYSTADNFQYSSLNVLVSVAVAYLTRLRCGATIDLTRFRRLYVFALICFASAGLEAVLGGLVQPVSKYGRFEDWMQWTLLDGVSLLIATPALLLMVRSGSAYVACDAARAERVSLLLATLMLETAAFAMGDTPIVLFVYPLLILTAFRAGPSWVLSSVMLTCLIAAAMTAHGYGPLVLLSSGSRVLRQDMIQAYFMSLFLAAVPANNALGEKNRAMHRLSHLKAVIEDDATYDTLTALLNRGAFRRRLAAALAAGSAGALILIDLDRFKQVNDTMGHLAGDALLRTFATRLKRVVGNGTVAARLGGDEFAVLLGPACRAGEMEDVCAAIVASARVPLRLAAAGPMVVSASVGATLIEGETGLDETFRRAVVALDAVKAGERDGYRAFDGSLDAAADEDLRLTGDLRAALHGAGGLVLHYQLKFGREGRPTGVEALIRWQHPQLGLVPPGRFIGLAEASGLILPLGGWVLREALAFARRWPDLTVAINISPMQMVAPGFLAETLAAFRASMARPGQIELEITETALLEEAHDPAETIAALRAAGLRIALDDFGTGYSSLGHLRCFRIDRLKIDRSFVLGLSDSPEAAAIIRAVIDLGHAVGLSVTAEGVETEAQRDHLLSAGIDELQGYFFARPLPEEALLVPGLVRVAA